VSAAAEAIWAEVPAYAASSDDQLRADVTAHIRGIFEAFLDVVRTGRPARRSGFAARPEQASRRVAPGITLTDFLQAFRVGQLTLAAVNHCDEVNFEKDHLPALLRPERDSNARPTA
jgi:hypothetical protein